jgi:putative flippase GtrA
MQKKTLLQILKFTLFSVSAGLIQIVSDIFLNEVVRLDAYISYLIALVLSVLFNFTVNRRFTFKSANNIAIAMLKVAGYYLVFTPLSTWWTKALTDIQVNEYIVLAGTMLINFITEFLFCKFVVYRNSENTNSLGKKEENK